MLTKQQAAEFIEISIRSLERYTRQGLIGADYVKGQHNRPTPMYEQGDLETLKARVHKGWRPGAAPASSANPVIAFRLPPVYMDRLRHEGQRRGMSPGECARQQLIDALEDGEHLRLTEDLAVLKRALDVLGADLGSAVLVLMLHAGKIREEAEARAWIEANLTCVRRLDARG